MQVLFYGDIAQRLGRELALAPAATVGALREALATAHPAHAADLRSPRLRAFVGDRPAADELPLAQTDTVEFLPPVSGG